MCNYNCKKLDWDTDYFGVSSARVDLHGKISINAKSDILDFCKNYKFITIFNKNNINENNLWICTKTNAFLTDMNIQFFKKIVDKPNCLNQETYVVSNLSRNKQIINIAKDAFNYSRFFNDKKLPLEQRTKIYLHWTECAFENDNKYFAISKVDGIIAGYILFSIKEDSSVIELIAVDEKYQGRRVGKSLIHRMESFVISRGITNITVGTQVNNISAMRFYSSMGFKYISCSSMYHLWTR